ncbi:MAG: sugar phosphate isomerase/epimerase [Planctomycetes bacterium]|nr:sugar phosphate isomerase/epimerase [Planctomycetota bacterium]
MKNRNIGINASYFYQDTLVSSVKRLAKAGFRKLEVTGIALNNLSPVKFKELAKFIEEEGIDCTSINVVGDLVPVNLGNLAAFNDKERNNALSHVKQSLDYACRLKCPVVVCDTGTSTEDLEPYAKQDECYFTALSGIINYASSLGIRILLLNVPGRRWIPWDGLPPDKTRVVERHVWPWRAWPNEEEVLKNISGRFKKNISWAFDTANAIVANGSTTLKLEDRICLYFKYGLDIVYLANHPGPYNRVWHRLLLHQPLWNGFYKYRDYRKLLKLLVEKHFHGNLMLQIAEKCPNEISLKKSLTILQ